MTSIRKRLKLTALLFPAIFLPAVWIATVGGSSNPRSVGELLLYAALLALAVSYSVTLFATALRADRPGVP